MGQHNSNFELASEARRAAERFDECEIKVIKETFKDLCHLNGGSTRIDKETFLQYLPLPGLLGERLFVVFDRKSSGEIDYEEFVCGLAVTCRGSWEEKVEFIFNLYDIHGQGAVNREELAALLNHVPKSIMRFGRAVSLDVADSHPEAPHHHNRQRHHRHQRRGKRQSPPPPSTRRPPRRQQVQQQHQQQQQQQTVHVPPSTADTPASALSGRFSLGTSPYSGTLCTGADAGADAGGDASGAAIGKSASREFPLDVREAGSTAGPALTTALTTEAGAAATEAGVMAVATARSPSLTPATLMQLDLGSLSPTGSVSLIDEVPARSGAGVGPGDGNVSEEGGGRAASASGGGGGEGMAPGGRGDGMAPEGGGGGSGRTRCRDDTLKSEGSMNDEGSNYALVAGVSGSGGGASTAAAHSHYAHWENFTNNDIVDQAFQDCDLNHSGNLSFSEFRLWVERNPMVTQFLQSVFPYDEHREWGNDRKHLPFIHNREFTGSISPILSETGAAGSSGDGESSDEETRRLLIKARNTSRDPHLREGIDRLLYQHAAGYLEGTCCGEEAAIPSTDTNGVTSFGEATPQNCEYPRRTSRRPSTESLRNLTAATHCSLINELSPRSAKAMQHQTVAKQGFLWKQGHRLRTWKQRWYVLVGNCIYYYQHEDDVYPCGVMFLTGSFVEPLQDGANERKGFWGIEISRNHEQNHRRRLYTRSTVEQRKWVKELRKASAVVPIERPETPPPYDLENVFSSSREMHVAPRLLWKKESDDFEIGQELGKGRFSRVCMCVNKHTLERKAVKIIMKEDMKAEEKNLLRTEIVIMKLVNHPNIIRMEAVYESKKDIFIVMELHSGGELFDRIVGRPRFNEDETFTVIQPLVESVAYLHEMGIVHRDLKPENILCGNRIGDLKIADFGLSKMVMPDEIMKMPCGTLTYVAPEVLTLNGYGKEADIWSVGTIMYLLLRGRLPFDGSTREEIIENTIHGTIAWQNDQVWAGFSDDCKDLVLGMLNKNVAQRYKAKDVLRHPWITLTRTTLLRGVKTRETPLVLTY